jgi:transposase
MAELLFDPSELSERLGEPAEVSGGKPRLRLPERDQIEFRSASLDQLLPPDHEARLVWEAVSKLDLSPWLREVKAVEGQVGRDTTDPRLLLALWVYATLKGIGSARELDRLCTRHIDYQWLCGGVSLNYHTLADFRSQGGDKWDGLLTQLVAGLMAEGLVRLERVAQDGMRVRASAGKSSFRRRATLEKCLAEAREQVETLKRLAEEQPDELNRRQLAARERAAHERQARVTAALEHCERLQRQREKRSQVSNEPVKEARASTTDPEARNMKFANGGYNPGYKHAVHYRYGQRHRRGRGGDQRRQRRRRTAADARSSGGPLRKEPGGGAGRWRLRHERGHRRCGPEPRLHGLCSPQGRGQAIGRGRRSLCEKERRFTGRGRLAGTHGDGRRQADL